MMVILSPAKTLNFEREIPNFSSASTPQFEADAHLLMGILATYSTVELQKLMAISPQLAHLNYERNLSFSLPETPHRQALFTFDGAVYEAMKPFDFTPSQLAFAQQKLRILSGLYGVLRPLDLMAPYRLEMGIKLPNPAGKTLYTYWQTKLTECFNLLCQADDQTLINLASIEYAKAIKLKSMGTHHRIITPIFKENRGEGPKVIALLAKRARGRMCRFIIENQITNPEELKNFSDGGYTFDEELSTSHEWVFVR